MRIQSKQPYMNNRQKTPQLPHHKNKWYVSLYLRPPAKTDFRRQKQGQHLAGGVATDLGEVFWKSTLCDITEDWFGEIKSLGRHFVKPTEATKGRLLFRSLLMTGDISWPHKLFKQMLQDFLEGKQAGPKNQDWFEISRSPLLLTACFHCSTESGSDSLLFPPKDFAVFGSLFSGFNEETLSMLSTRQQQQQQQLPVCVTAKPLQ